MARQAGRAMRVESSRPLDKSVAADISFAAGGTWTATSEAKNLICHCSPADEVAGRRNVA